MTSSNKQELTKLPAPQSNTVAIDQASDTLIGRTLKITIKYQGLLLAYLVSVAATVGGLGYLGYNNAVLVGWEITAGVVITILPLLATFFCLTLPAWRKKRREARLKAWSILGRETRTEYFRIGPYENIEQDRQDFDRADQAHKKVLRWIEKTKEPLLFLTGTSGVGKSSLLNAYVIPHLRECETPTRVITLRSFDDPLAKLREQLLTPEVIWQKPPKQDEDVSLLRILQDACEYLDKKKELLLLVFDQFEELLILHENNPDAASQTKQCVDKQDTFPAVVEHVQQFIKEIKNQSQTNLCVLLSLRTDYEGMLSSLELPSLEQDRNWFKVNPFTPRAAREFLADGFEQVGEKLLDSVMQEAASLEEARGLIRPITLNMLGTVLNHYTGELPAKHQRGGLLGADLRRTLDSEDLRDHARLVLAPLLTAAGTKHPRSVRILADKTKLEHHAVEGCLLGLQNGGLVRRLNRAESLPDRVWEISHDFVARLLLTILYAPQRTAWKRVRPVILPVSIAIWLLMFTVLLPSYIRAIPQRAADRLRVEFDAEVIPPDENRGWHVKVDTKEYTESKLQQLFTELHALKVDSLHLRNYTLTELSESLGNLTQLTTLDLAHNELTELPETLGNLTQLTNLNLSENRLTEIPAAVGKFTQLTTLNLGSNRLTELPEMLGNLTRLTNLNLSDNRLTELPESLGNLTRLTELNLRSNHLTGLPESLRNLTRLANLNLSDNQLSELPKTLDDLTRLTNLNLSDNHLTEVLKTLGNLTQLTEISLSSNYLTELPETLGNLTQLTEISLSSNYLTELPETLGNLTRLTELDLARNQLTELPETLGTLTRLTELDLRGNELTELPEALGNLTRLTTLNLAYNRLTELPETLDNLTRLTYLDLARNELTELPETLGNLTQLASLNLRGNELTELPEALGELTELRRLDIGYNKLTEMPECLGKLVKLMELSQGFSKLTELPEELGELTELRRLDLSRNQLTELPEELGKLTHLETLDLTGNKLKKLPEILVNFTQLRFLKLAQNPLYPEPAEAYDQGLNTVQKYLRERSANAVGTK